MDYLDHQKQRRHGILLLVGYVCIAIAIIFATIVLVYQAYGFGLDRNGTVIQNGIVFFSSHPNPAKIYIDNKLYKSQTNTRAALPANIYKIRLVRIGYQDWQRTIEVDGGSVMHFDYPLLLPKIIKTTTVDSLTALPDLATQSPDRRWLITSSATRATDFQVYDLKNPDKAALTLSLPANVATAATTREQWLAAEWSDDNQHVLLQHAIDDKVEFIVLDRNDPTQSVNLNQTLSISPTSVTLKDKRYDQYYLYNAGDQSLQTASLKTAAVSPLLNNILAYKSYGSDSLLYITSADAPAGKVQLKLLTGDRTILLRSFPTSSHYLVDLATYDGTPYVVASSSDEGKVYIYRDPRAQLANHPAQVIVPIQVLRVANPNFESFSSNAQFVMAENGNMMAVYDLRNKNGYNYTIKNTLDAPQSHATWMDGNRLTYISNGKVQIVDYDNMNAHSFAPSSATMRPFFSPDYARVYTLTTATAGATLNVTSLRTLADQ